MVPCYTRSQRLLSPKEFSSVLRKPAVNLSKGPLRIRAIKNRMPTARLGVVVPKKGTRLAVRRNRVKRLVRESFRLHLSDLPSVDIVVQVFSSVEDDRLVKLLDQQFAIIAAQLSSE